MTGETLTERALLAFSAILREGDVFAVHNGEDVKLKTVAVAGEKLVGIVGTSSGGVKVIDITSDKLVRVLREIIFDTSNGDIEGE